MASDKKEKINPEIQQLLKSLVDDFDKDDRAVRERQIRLWRRLKLYWEGFQRVWWSETAQDWRVYDEQLNAESYSDQSFYDKPINIFRGLLESIIAALSITVPGIVCYPDDADNPLDISTAKVSNQIGKLIYRHNDATLLWLHALYIWCTEGMIAAYTYPKEDADYGSYEQKEFEDEEIESHVCPNCGIQLDSSLFDSGNSSLSNPSESPEPSQPQTQGQDLEAGAEQISNRELDEFDPDDEDAPLHDLLKNEHQVVCPACAESLDPNLQKTKLTVTRLVGTTTKPKSRQCIEVYGGLHVKVPNWARNQNECPYLIRAHEEHYSLALAKFPHLEKDDINLKTSSGGMYDPYERWGRLNPQYNGEYPLNLVTIRECWIRAEAFHALKEDECKKLQKEFPDGVKVTFVNEIFAEAENEALDDCWTISEFPLADFLHHDPHGMLLVNVQDITNELVSLILQTIEHGISQTFADPAVLNFDEYKQMETAPGMIIPTKAPRTGQKIADGFFETRTANLSAEVMPFAQKIQEFGQFVSGALPSLFGGALEGTRTASEYSMSRSQALQRLQNNWKILLVWWKKTLGKSINGFIQSVNEDERYVERDENGAFYNVFIRKAELLGKIGNIELEASENLPLSWAQKKDTIMQFMQASNPVIMQAILDPENINLFKDAIGLDEFNIPGEDDRQKQYEEIQILVSSEPIEVPAPPDPNNPMMPSAPQEQPSVPIDQDVDNHQIEAAICRHWLVSDAGRLAKMENQKGYRNVLLHMKQHLQIIQQQQMQQMQQQMMMQQQQQKQNRPPASGAKNQQIAAQPPQQSQGVAQ